MRGVRLEPTGAARPETDAARKRAAVEMIARHERALKRTARRFSLDAEDADDAYQRALEIVLTKAPTTDPRELIRWTQTVIRHEALAVRESRERLLGFHAPREGAPDPLASIPAEGSEPGEQAERREAVARTREALQALKPAELRALSLLASGYSYVEIGEITGFSRTKINRVLAEGRNRFRALLSSSEDGSRCRELGPLLSAFCDGEASPGDAATVREHLRACARCRSTMRAYRAAPRIAAALAPAFPPSRSLLERAHDALAGIASRLPGMGGGAESATQMGAAGSAGGIGVTGLAKLLALCAGAAGTATACIATGALPGLPADADPPPRSAIERAADRPRAATVEYEPTQPLAPRPDPPAKREPKDQAGEASADVAATPTGAVEYEAPSPVEPPPPVEAPSPVEPPPPPESVATPPSSGSSAGEFGP
ncbi:MAG TPA: sigma-70 family RNA polymerase sigma factor [Solirubrobacterales bacterium]